MAEKILALATMEKLLKKGGAPRVSDDAKVALQEVLENIAQGISEKAAKFAAHSKRKTVKADDVKLAAQ